MIILFMGSFDPVTKAHLKIAQFTSKSLQNSTILFTPASDLYNKESLATPFIDRYNMIKLVTKNLKYIDATSIENEYSKAYKKQPKTIETLDYFSNKYKENNLAILIGSDNYQNLTKRYKIEDLLRKYKVIVYPRIENFRFLNNSLFKKYKDSFIFLKPNEIYDISSTQARFNIMNNIKNDDLLDKKVIKYIKENNLKFEK